MNKFQAAQVIQEIKAYTKELRQIRVHHKMSSEPEILKMLSKVHGVLFKQQLIQIKFQKQLMKMLKK
jgi:hypothetical protein